jgi:hypothetical protein
MKIARVPLLYRLLLVSVAFALVKAVIHYRSPGVTGIAQALQATFAMSANALGVYGIAMTLTLLHWAGYLDFSGRSQRATYGQDAYADDEHGKGHPLPGSIDSPYDSYGDVKALSND